MARKWVLGFFLIGLALFFLMIVVGNVATARTNPPVTQTINWDSPRTEELVRRACFDCHSNETNYPWYAYVAPVSFLVMRDVNEGRGEFNFSTDNMLNSRKMIEAIEEGEMPLPIYLITHPEARLTDSEKQELIDGLRATFRGRND